VLLIFGTILAVAIFAMVLLAARDAHQRRIREESRPIAERVADIRNDATFMVEEFQRVLQRHKTERPQQVDWIPGALDLYRRLESLASSPNSSADECLALADEASKYVREKRLKGIIVSSQARRLAVLLSKENAA